MMILAALAAGASERLATSIIAQIDSGDKKGALLKKRKGMPLKMKKRVQQKMKKRPLQSRDSVSVLRLRRLNVRITRKRTWLGDL
jgi:hypothetical protein